MTFGRWFEQAPYLPQCGVLARMRHSARLNELPEHAQYATCELLRGTMTRHNFVAYRCDRHTESQPIHFRGANWRQYVPIRLPWTVCIREDVPPGSVAVLVNRAHRHADLALELNAAEYRLFTEIDGRRTLGEIIQNSKKEEDPALRFFQQLWEYDQIVIDASCA
jgi:hypothetical protein